MCLNIIQKRAIKYINGPCLILAGAGSGKTKVIINKIIYLINCGQYQPHNIAAITFTNKAADEMRVRLSKHLNYLKINQIIVSTFHSLGLKIIKKEIQELNLKSNFTLFDEKDQVHLIKKICQQEIKNNIKSLKKIIFMISHWKNKFLTPEQVYKSTLSHEENFFAYVYEKYNNYLSEANILDFDDLICIPTLLLKNNTIVQNRWQKKITYLLVDEYQDTNNSQYELIKILTQSNKNFTLVGDDDQSIYTWRGANPKNINSLIQDFPNLEIIKMEHNYRSSGRILNIANCLIANNTHFLEKKLFSQLQYGNYIKVLTGRNEEQEAEKIVETMITQNIKNNTKYEDYAILYRNNYQSRILEKILIKKNIPYYISEKSSFFFRPEIKYLLSYLRLIINNNDNDSFMRIINIPSRKIGKITLKKLEDKANETKQSLFQVSENLEINSFLAQNTINKIKKFILKIKKFTKKSFLKEYNIIDYIINDTHYEKWIFKTFKESNKIENSINNIHTLSKWFQNMIEGNIFEKPMNLSQIVERMTIRDLTNQNTKDKKNNQVQLMTLHASKGLEFSSVFIIGMCEGILPNQKSIDKNNLEEERRLTYVGITRAKKQLFFTYSQTYQKYGQKMDMLPSRFLFELPHEDLKWDQKCVLNTSIDQIEKSKYRILNLKKIIAK
ncbi:UvrD-helicase domain-containing protein [Buchnera aphidicola]|uniref:DNA 3'-5' helicase n=1 Tax=Buchnera aphidicola subsp. Uroleucon sonchi TaxID=118118 RepID=A0A6C1FIP1_BUCUN|nr:UvrD-helicase domain-containing protein [Buchnera aphidicola]QIE02259.1 UvrD-helicase domain-containing protein [Buchnera aphidicola (Uroleucon sonchi)]